MQGSRMLVLVAVLALVGQFWLRRCSVRLARACLDCLQSAAVVLQPCLNVASLLCGNNFVFNCCMSCHSGETAQH